MMSNPPLRLERLKKGIDACDAIFTSLVAVEKFLLPYYARFRSVTEVRAMRDGFCTDPKALAVTHLPDSVEDKAVMTNLYVARAEVNKETTTVGLVSIDEFIEPYL